MTYFKSLEEIREWVLLHEKNIDTAYDTMVAIKALWNDGYNEAFVDAAVPPGETPRPSSFIAEDAGDLSVATEQLQEEPPDYSTESRDPPYGMTYEEYIREGEVAFPDQTPDEEVEAPALHGPEEVEREISGLSANLSPPYTTHDRAFIESSPTQRTLSLPDGYKAILTLDQESNRYRCGSAVIAKDILDRAEGAARDSLLRGILEVVKRTMPLLVVAGNHREFVHWCDQHGYQWMSLYGKVFPCAKYIGVAEEVMSYDNREQRIRFVGNYRESDAFRGTNMFNLHNYIIGSSDPELRSHAEGDVDPDEARAWTQLTSRLNNDEPPAEGTYSGQLSPPPTQSEVQEAVDYFRRSDPNGLEAIRTRLEPHYFHRLRLSPWAIKMKLTLFARNSTFEPYEPQLRPIYWTRPTVPFIELIESMVLNVEYNPIQSVYDSLDYRTRVLGERPEDLEPPEEDPDVDGFYH